MPRRKKPHRQVAATRADLKKHVHALGLGNVEEYRRWCRNRGLGTGLQKSLLKFEKERKLATRLQGDAILSRTRQRTRRPGNTITLLYRGHVQKGRLGADYLLKIRSLFKDLEDDGRTRRAFYDLLMQVERHDDLLSLEPAVAALGPNPGNTFVEALCELARHRDNWIRRPDEWQPDSHNTRRKFGSLARHLLAQYAVPSFMDTAWFQGDRDTARREQRWFVHIGRGGNIRKADIPVVLTKMMAHRFLAAPDHLLIRAALRWGQVLGQGGTESLAREIIASLLGRSFDHEEFWSGVILYFTNHPMLDPAQVGPLVDFIHNQKYMPQEVILPGGRTEMAPPPQPNFSVKARGIEKLIHQMEEWHYQLAELPERPEDVQEEGVNGGGRRRSRKRFHAWSPSGVRPHQYEETKVGGVGDRIWTIQELLSTRELAAEGSRMNHCVATYARSCKRGGMSIWSMQVAEGGKRTSVLTVAVDTATRRITQIRGRFNMQPKAKLKSGNAAKLENREKRYLATSMNVVRSWMEREGLARAW